MHQKKKGSHIEAEGKDVVEPKKSEVENQRQRNRQSFISGVHDITHVVVATAKEAAAREVKPKTSTASESRQLPNLKPNQK